MPDILLIQPPVRDFYLTAKRTIPYGLACIAAALKKAGFSVDIFDSLATAKSRAVVLPAEMDYLKEYYPKPDISPFALFHHFKHFGYSFEHIGKIARESGAFLIGISSLFTAYGSEAETTARIVKKFHPNCLVVLGGHHPTAFPEKVMECEAVDFVLRGEGEVGMPLLAKAIRNSESGIENIPGIVFRKPDKSLHIGEPAIMENPEDYPLPAIELIKNSFYRRGKRGGAVIVASRGCPMKCSYCSLSSSKYRRRSVESVIREIEIAVTCHDAGFIDFEDENLSLEREWFIKLLYEIKTRFGTSALELRAMNGLFPPSLDEEVILLMKEAGFKTLNLSVGSTSAEQLRKFRRPDIRKSLETVILLAEKYGLNTVCYVIAGAPGQSAEDSLSDLFYFARKKAIVGVSVFYPAAGSADFESAEQNKILPEHFSLMRSSAFPISRNRLETVTILRLARILNFIKLLDSEGISLPLPSDENISESGNDRRAIGIRLLSRFLHDGRIRGMTTEGEVFEHRISGELTEKFIRNIILSAHSAL